MKPEAHGGGKRDVGRKRKQREAPRKASPAADHASPDHASADRASPQRPHHRAAERAPEGALGDVLLHTDADAARMSDALGASAFTVGRDVYFASSAYRPGSTDGDRLLAHELAHVAAHAHDDRHVHRQSFGGTRCQGTANLPGNPNWTGTWEHVVIQQYYTTFINPTAEAEYFIPYSGPRGGHSTADIVDPVGGGIYEIKSIYAVGEATSKLVRSIDMAYEHCDAGVRWHAGTQYWAPPLPISSTEVLITELRSPGLITYYRRPRVAPPIPVRLPFPHPVTAPQPTPIADGRPTTHDTPEAPPVYGPPPYEPLAKTTLLTAALAAAAKLAQPYVQPALKYVAGQLAVRAFAVAGAEGTMFVSGGTVAGSGGAALAAKASRWSRVMALGSRAGIIGAAAAATYLVFDALAQYTYGSIYQGTRGARLQQTYQRIGMAAEFLGSSAEVADNAQSMLFEAGGEDLESADNAALRDHYFECLYQLRMSLYGLGTELQDAAREFSAIGDELELGADFMLEMAVEQADMIIASGDTSFYMLQALHMHLEEMTRWSETKLGLLIDNFERVFKRDASNWLARKR